MNKRKIVLEILGATLACFAMSFMIAKASGLNHEAAYPQSIFNHYIAEFKCSPDPVNETKSVLKKFAADEFFEINLNLIATDVDVQPSDTGFIEYRYEGVTQLKLTEKIEGRTLSITESSADDQNQGWKLNCGPGWGKGFNFNFNLHSSGETRIYLKIPPNVQSLVLHTISGGVQLSAVSLNRLEYKTISGDAKINGDFPTFSIQSVSGDIHLENACILPKGEVATTSGDIQMKVPKEFNAQFAAKVLSGDIQIRDAEAQVESDGNSLQKTFGKGAGSLKVNSTSGDIELELQTIALRSFPTTLQSKKTK